MVKILNRTPSPTYKDTATPSLYLFIAFPVLFHLWMVYRFTTNMPYLDDYTFIVDVLNLKKGGVTAGTLLHALFNPHGEHVIFFARLTALLDYVVEGQLNFRTLFFVGNATLIGTAWILYRIARQGGLSVAQTIPVFWIMFQPQYYENTLTWAICSLQHIPGLFFAFVAFYLLTKPAKASFYLSIPVAFLATFSNGNGLATLIVGIFLLIVFRRRKQLLVWLLFSVICFGLHYYLAHLSSVTPVTSNLLHPFRVLGGFFLMSGSMGLLATKSLPMLGLLGVFITLLVMIVGVMTLIRFTGRKRYTHLLPSYFKQQLDRWSTPTIKPASITLLGACGYLFITLAGISFARDQGWHYGLVLPRFIWFATVLSVVGYLMGLLGLQSKYRVRVVQLAIVGSVLFSISSYRLTINEMRSVQQSLISDAYNWRENNLLITMPANRNANDGYYRTLMAAAIREQVYELPPALFDPSSGRRSTVVTNRLIENDSAFTQDDRRYRLLTFAGTIVPEQTVVRKESYLLLKSSQHVFVWPINQSSTKLSLFLFTGFVKTSAPMAAVIADLLPPAMYQLGLCQLRKGKWISTYSRQQLDLTRPLRN